jgi:hypothetical protein
LYDDVESKIITSSEKASSPWVIYKSYHEAAPIWWYVIF